ncbi:carbohydrate ABC transporter permease [Phytoactinopolyspora halotolerans]|uniref:Sugar ABC transporter permease n=1 Tax=Phytoactinopolyspora halotolerans TaxID=1981512 RepID=A0A6L9S592_9ACTN|nr:sugar ABC transporter permease [Phytoactinopolyspora halotolerans]NED99910.1 sugar ABC transporter permease [Phytoactinopolyspora halotolerans]
MARRIRHGAGVRDASAPASAASDPDDAASSGNPTAESSGTRAAASGSGRKFHLRRQGRAAHVFLLPWLLGFGLVTSVPLFASLYLAFTDYNVLSSPRFTGLSNFERMLSDDRFWAAVSVTARYVFISVPLQLGFALLLALILDRGLRGLAFYRGAFYLPSLLGSSVAVAILWREIFGHDGLVNDALAWFGIEGQSWLQNPSTALSTLMVLNVWTFGSPMVIFLAGLRQIPEDLYEAARVDGASKIRQFTHVTIPLLTPIIFFNLILQTIGSFQAFTQAHIISGGTGGPVDSTLFYTLYLYQQGFNSFNMGYASALAWVLMLAIAVVTAIHFFLSKYWVFYGDD